MQSMRQYVAAAGPTMCVRCKYMPATVRGHRFPIDLRDALMVHVDHKVLKCVMCVISAYIKWLIEPVQTRRVQIVYMESVRCLLITLPHAVHYTYFKATVREQLVEQQTAFQQMLNNKTVVCCRV